MGAYISKLSILGWYDDNTKVRGINGFLKKFLTNKTSLGEFVLQFDVALMALWENEHDADHDSKYKDLTLLTCLPMEK
jgi:hypothetical protein